MSKFDDMICGLQQDIEIPENVRRRCTDTFSKLPDKLEKPSRTFSKRRIWPAAAAATLVISVSVSAAAYIQWSRGMEARLEATPEQRQVLEDNQTVSFAGQSVTQGDITVTMQQSIVDNYFAYLSFKVEGYKAEDGVQPGFSGMSIVVGDDGEYEGDLSAGFYDGLMQGEDGKAVHADGTPLAEGELESYTMEDGSMEYQISMMSKEKGYFIDKPIHVELRDLGTYDGKAGDVVVDAEGTWGFDWTLSGNDGVRTYELDEPLEDSGATILQAELSPISFSATYEFPRHKETEMGTDKNSKDIAHTTYATPPLFTGVRLKDGTIYTGVSGGGSFSGYAAEDTDVYEYTTAMRRVIDVEQVESLLFIKSYPEGGQPLSGDNLYFVSVE